MFLHRLRRAALHLPLQRQERGLLYFHHGLLVNRSGFIFYDIVSCGFMETT
jgi:hypothetical protein